MPEYVKKKLFYLACFWVGGHGRTKHCGTFD